MNSTQGLLLGLCSLSMLASETPDRERANQDRKDAGVSVPKVEYRSGIYHLVLDAKTPHARGIQHGRALAFPIRKTLVKFKEWLRVNAGLKNPDRLIREFVKNTTHMAAARQAYPDLYAEMEGIATGAEVSVTDLFVYQSFDELFLFLMKSGALDQANGHCTTLGVYGRPGKPNFVTHNNDIPTYHEDAVTVLRIRYPDSDLEILQSTFVGQIGQNGVNNRGLAVGINTLANLPVTSSGIPVSFHVRKILMCKDVAEARTYLETIEAATAMNYMVADRQSIQSIETWKDKSAVVGFKGKFAVHTNHTLIPGAPVTFQMSASSGGGSYGFTQQRFDLATSVLAKTSGEVGFDGIKKLMGTRPILVNPGKPTGRTLMSMIVEIPSKGAPILHLTPDSPNWFGYVDFTF